MQISTFNQTQSLLFIGSVAAFLISLFYQVKDKEKLSFLFLLLSALLVYTFGALLDPFLNLWDERFHALVAKNMMPHPFMPTLHDDPVLNISYTGWTGYHVWLHKQPLFLWQIALSFKLFGISEFSLRIPNIILGTLVVFSVYKSARLLLDQRTAFIAGTMVICSHFLLELVAGRQELDHNDLSFIAYISLSIWALTEYSFQPKMKWIILIGLFSGMAILCKWLVGLLVYLGWFILNVQQKKWKPIDYKDFLISLAVTLIIALPWQVYTFIQYPALALEAYQFNVKHFNTVLEGHEGTFFYHIIQMKRIYGTYSQYLIIPALVIFYIKSKDKKLYFSFIGMLLAVYLFFSLAATKMPSFTVVTLAFIIIAFASMFSFLLNFILSHQWFSSGSKWMFAIIILAFSLIKFDMKSVIRNHATNRGTETISDILSYNSLFLKSLPIDKETVVFKVNGLSKIDVMFYHGIEAYDFMPSQEHCNILKQKNRKIAILKYQNEVLPDYILSNPDIIIINNQLKGYY